MHIRIFTIAYGGHVDLLKRLAMSLSWPKNRKALENSSWEIQTKDPARVREILSPMGIPLEVVEYKNTYIGALADQAEKCSKNKWCMFAANPDFIWGDGSIQSLKTIAEEDEGICVSLPHPRVSSDTFPDLKEPTSNSRLVGLAFQHMHQSWKFSNVSLRETSCYNGGVAWRSIGENLWGVTARLPSPFFARCLPGDSEVLRNGGSGAWDHEWPTKLVEQQRQRVIGSSDAAFAVELTRPASNMVSLEGRRTPVDSYRRDLLHHRVNRNTMTIWRAE